MRYTGVTKKMQTYFYLIYRRKKQVLQLYSSNTYRYFKEDKMRKVLFLVLAALLATTSLQAQPAVPEFAPLPYAFDALEPYIDAQTMEIHYSRHHRAYYDNMLKAASGSAFLERGLQEALTEIASWPEALRNNAGGHFNHDLFWRVMAPRAGGEPQGKLAEKINTAFESFEKFKEEFKKAALGRFGSGWAWLCVDTDGGLFITSTANQDNPLMNVGNRKGIPILGLDVWEHAYYLKYQNQRGGYIDAFWNVVNWPEVTLRLERALAAN